jgi:hypothetical protein
VVKYHGLAHRFLIAVTRCSMRPQLNSGTLGGRTQFCSGASVQLAESALMF